MNLKNIEYQFSTDVLVIGAGIAGIRAADAARKKNVKTLLASSGCMASPGVIGFNAPMATEDSPELFLKDILRSAGGAGDRILMERLASGAAECVRELEAEGLVFDRRPDGSFHLLRPLGCSCPRLVHCGNITAKLYLETMRSRMPDPVDFFVLDLLVSDGAVCGAFGIFDGKQAIISARAVVLATGGGGGIYGRTTYPASAVGNGYALARRAGAKLRDMEFVQFEPLRCVKFPMGVSTTILEKGGALFNGYGERFLKTAFPSGEGALSKAELALNIAKELAAGRGGIFLDLSGLPGDAVTRDHAIYNQRFRNVGIDLTRDRIEVAPAAHTFLGGVEVDVHCASSVPGLFAAGEVMGGLHGADRIGGNAGAEIFIFGAIAGNAAAEYAKTHPQRKLCPPPFPSACGTREEARNGMERLRTLTESLLGVIRNRKGLECACAGFSAMQEEISAARTGSIQDARAFFEWKNALETASSVAEAALKRERSLGVHFRADESLALPKQ